MTHLTDTAAHYGLHLYQARTDGLAGSWDAYRLTRAANMKGSE